ncbi:uncharacterized protein A1O9_07168 [Exophiala aquamarina CBS 119918]|uniref:Cation/H+ exchanger transmembrane domain-containing protein n=1 Tax=Exophiala aquamarina CBS 119918 TaxID=1182545 RepID=A0A072PCF5_9EURO|nr:uncharacterized protein A1O9_07168 [Exophiala aquamarina CBS 119918]KEF56978.1 hypothetical protein A1O9_07168 [Exophiala aquamarina CBS 119918]
MATATITEFVTRTVNATAATATASNRATPQGGIFEHVNPTHYDPKTPITLFIIQASIVIVLTRLIHWPLTLLRQPRVIAEVLTGILLGPSVMGRIPGFTSHIFPPASMPAFSLAANLGLVLFLFLVGLEVDIRFLVSNWRIALSVGALGMALPFGLGAGIAYGLFHEFRDDSGLAPISFGIYMLFIGVAMAITAFPVLCRILTSLKLLGTPVGVIVLSAGVGNDVVGWILLALCVALVNSGAGLTALWILLVAVGYSLLVAYPIRWALLYLLRRTGSLANGPTQTVVAVTVMLVLASSFFTQIIGIHAIFGAFMIGLICPHEGGFAIKLTEKIEDLISILFLPLYFALSGLNTDLGLLNSGITWAYVVGVCAIAFIGKIAGGTLASRLNGLVWRESLTIGCLMSCKGLVELIVLNIGLQARILSTRTFTIFVVMALVTTFATTPLVVWLYPPWYQQKLELWKQGKIDWDGNRLHHDDDEDESSDSSEQNALRTAEVARKVLVYLRLDGLPSLFTMVSLFARKREDLDTLSPPSSPVATREGELAEAVMTQPQALSSVVTLRRPLQVHGLRLMELTERESSVMRVSEIEEFASRDPVIKAFGTFGQSRDIAVGGQIAVVPDHSFSGTLLTRARDLRSDLILLPWSETGTMSEYPSLFDAKPANPLANMEFSSLAAEIFRKAHDTCSVGVLIDKTALTAENSTTDSSAEARAPRPLARTLTGVSVAEQLKSSVHFKLSDSSRYRLFVLYSGSDDDLYAVKLGLQLVKNEAVDLIILNVRPTPVPHDDDEGDHVLEIKDSGNGGAAKSRNADFEFETIRTSLLHFLRRRVTFVDLDISPLDAITAAIAEPSAAETIVLIGRGAPASSSGALFNSLSNSGILGGGSSSTAVAGDSRALGPFATRLVRSVREKGLATALLVVQARRQIDDEAVGPATATAGAVPVAKDAKGSVSVPAGNHHLMRKSSQMSDD